MNLASPEDIAAHVASVKALGLGGDTVTVYITEETAREIADVAAANTDAVYVPALDAQGRQVHVAFRREPFLPSGDD